MNSRVFDPERMATAEPRVRALRAGMDRPEYPLAVHVSERRPWHPDAMGLAAVACGVLARHRPDVVCEPAAPGVRVLAKDEACVDSAIRTLRAHYRGGRLRISGPYVRYWPSDPPCEPVMSVRVRVPRPYVRSVRLDLARRGARGLAHEARLFMGVVRAEVPLVTLLGFARWLDDATYGFGSSTMRLKRYEHLAPPVGPGRATHSMRQPASITHTPTGTQAPVDGIGTGLVTTPWAASIGSVGRTHWNIAKIV